MYKNAIGTRDKTIIWFCKVILKVHVLELLGGGEASKRLKGGHRVLSLQKWDSGPFLFFSLSDHNTNTLFCHSLPPDVPPLLQAQKQQEQPVLDWSAQIMSQKNLVSISWLITSGVCYSKRASSALENFRKSKCHTALSPALGLRWKKKISVVLAMSGPWLVDTKQPCAAPLFPLLCLPHSWDQEP